MYMGVLALFLTLTAVCSGLPPFEIRSAPSLRSAPRNLDSAREDSSLKGCEVSESGRRQFLCPSTTWLVPECIDTTQLCDTVRDCPDSEDENPLICLYLRVRQGSRKAWQAKRQWV